MVDTLQPFKYSPLADLPQPDGGIQLEERSFVGKVNLRGDSDDNSFLAGVQAALGLDLPLQPNTTSTNETTTLFWLGPDEWLIHGPEGSQQTMMTRLQESLAGQHVALTDVTDYYLVIRLSGDKARDVLSKGTPFDTEPDLFGAGQCAQTVFGHASILIHNLSPVEAYDIQVRWSFGQYLWGYLVDGAREYG